MNTHTLVILLLFLPSCIAVKSKPPVLSCSDLSTKANSQYEEMTVYEARKAYARIVDKCKDDIDSLYRLAVIDLKIGDLPESRAGLLKVISQDPSFAKAYYNLGIIYSSATPERNYIKAKISFQKHLELQPESSRKEQVTTWLKKKKDIPTKGIYLIPTSPDSPEYQNGMNAYQKKDFKTASENFENYLTKNTNDVEIRSKLGVCYLKLGQLKKSRDEFLKILLINDYFHKAYYNLGALYSAKSDFKNIDKVHFFFKKFLLLNPDSPQADEIQQWLKLN